MRLWSISPSFLDDIGLVALWREGLLAQKVLMGNTKGYKNHPQLERFKNTDNPVGYLNNYLTTIHAESVIRGFNFDYMKINPNTQCRKLIEVSCGQIIFEFEHLQKKLKVRNPRKFERNEILVNIYKHSKYMASYSVKNSCFQQTENTEIESWEKNV